MKLKTELKTRIKIKISLISLVIFYGPSVWAHSPSTVNNNNKGVESLLNEETQEAYRHFLKALTTEPFQSQVRINLGLVFEANKEFDKAYNEYMAAYRYANSDEERFIALFNAGNALKEAKKIDLALEVYQRALEIQPDSKEVKTNIELLWQGGGGGGDGQEENPDKGDNQNQSPEGEGQEPQQQQKPQPKEFEGQDLTESDVRKILEELKNQEQQIRAKEYEKGPKSAPKDKDW